MKKLFICLFLFLITLNSNADDGQRILRLEKELSVIKDRLAKVESLTVDSGASPSNLARVDGWKSLSNWRSLRTGMSAIEVANILGQPHRVRGGDVAFWYYQNDSYVTFMSDKVHSWSEPR